MQVACLYTFSVGHARNEITQGSVKLRNLTGVLAVERCTLIICEPEIHVRESHAWKTHGQNGSNIIQQEFSLRHVDFVSLGICGGALQIEVKSESDVIASVDSNTCRILRQ